MGLERLARQGEALFAGLDPGACLGHGPRPRYTRSKGGYRLSLPLPGARAEDLDVAKVEGELVVTTASRRRAIALPRRVAALDLAGARLEGGSLVVRFGVGAAS